MLLNRILPVEKQQLASWSELANLISTSEDLFGVKKQENYLIDYGSLPLEKDVLDYLLSLNKENLINIYFYSSTGESLDATQKKLLQKTDIEYTNLKNKNDNLASSIAEKYAEKLGLNLKYNEISSIVKQSTNYQEIIDSLDFIDLADDKAKAFQSLLKVEKTPIFVLGFDVQKLSDQAVKWYKEITEDEIQLGLSLIFGKLEKQKSLKANNLQKDLILTDKNIKTRSKVGGIVWWKMFLWKSKNSK